MEFVFTVWMIALLIWLVVLAGLWIYESGYDQGKVIGRLQGCRCRKQGGACPCQQAGKNGEATNDKVSG
jgi:hypothetical protein